MVKKNLDICLVTYNRTKELEKILKILSEQTNKIFNLLISDDGSSTILNPNDFPIISKYLWHKDEGFHRTLRFNELMDICVSPNILILDDDCVPVSTEFINAHLNALQDSEVINGKVRINGRFAPFCWGGCNFSIKKDVIDKIGLYDINYDGHYGLDDVDFGQKLKQYGIKIKEGNNLTVADHIGAFYANGDRSEEVVGHNRNYFFKKWGVLPDPSKLKFL